MHPSKESGGAPKLNLFTLGDFEYIQGKIQDRILSLSEQYIIENGMSASAFEQMKALLDRWVRHMFNIITPNILINGIPYTVATSMNETYEPRSLELVDTLEELSKKRSELFMKVLKLRDQIPSAVYEDVLRSNKKASSEYITKNAPPPIELVKEIDDANVFPLTTNANERYNTFSDSYLKVSHRTKELCSVLESLNDVLSKAITLVGDPNKGKAQDGKIQNQT